MSGHPTRTVTYDLAGHPKGWKGEELRFRLVNLTYTAEHQIPRHLITSVIGEDGQGEVELFANGEGIETSKWQVKFPDDTRVEFTVPPGEGPVSLSTLLEAGVTADSAQGETLITFLLGLWKDEWDAETQYERGEQVHHLGNSWIALKANQGQAPPETWDGESEDWSLLARGEETAAAQEAREGAEAARDKAEEWAESPEDQPHETDPDQFSALHHAAKAGASADAASTSADAAQAAEAGAESAKEKAARWADEDEDVPVEEDPDRFSALHHAAKAAGVVDAHDDDVEAHPDRQDDIISTYLTLHRRLRALADRVDALEEAGE